MADDSQTLRLEVATPTGLVLQTQASSVQAPSVKGEFGVLPRHLPILSALKAGVLAYEQDHQKRVAAVGPGFVEAGPDKVLILTETYLEPKAIDVAKARKDREEAEAKLKAGADPTRQAELLRDVEWAVAREEAHKISLQP